MIKILTELQSIAQTGLFYSKDQYDTERYQRLNEIVAGLLSQNSSISLENILSQFKIELGHATPKVDVRGALFVDNKIVLVREKEDGKWALPGGWADVNFSPAENIAREIKEESGYEVQVSKLIGIYDKSKANSDKSWPYAYKIFFLCEPLSRDEVNNLDEREIFEVSSFAQDEIPELSEGRVNKEQIKHCFDHFSNRSLLPYFD
ncbi:MAG: NUDIX hydrolase [Rickettsiaceae bacterium]|nr:NUDIX hydrolase [Rickettsiaceae bacterium]